MDKVFLVIQLRDGSSRWEVQGVFTTEEKAIGVCKSPLWCYSHFNLDEVLQDEPRGDKRWIYPVDQKEESKRDNGTKE